MTPELAHNNLVCAIQYYASNKDADGAFVEVERAISTLVSVETEACYLACKNDRDEPVGGDKEWLAGYACGVNDCKAVVYGRIARAQERQR